MPQTLQCKLRAAEGFARPEIATAMMAAASPRSGDNVDLIEGGANFRRTKSCLSASHDPCVCADRIGLLFPVASAGPVLKGDLA
jgi:hypothetical protein